MTARRRALRARRETLQQVAALQRAELAGEYQEIKGSLSLAERALVLARRIGARPALLLAGAAVLAAFGPARVIRYAWRGYTLYTTARSLLRR